MRKQLSINCGPRSLTKALRANASGAAGGRDSLPATERLGQSKPEIGEACVGSWTPNDATILTESAARESQMRPQTLFPCSELHTHNDKD